MYNLAPLPFSYDALEPMIDSATMALHHDKHHQTYVDNYNKLVANLPEIRNLSPEEAIKNLQRLQIDETTKTALRNQGGGVVNHNFFWQVMDPKNHKDEKLTGEIVKHFGNLQAFKEQFTQTALKHFGSGWAWLVRTPDNRLKVYSTANQDSPLSEGETPLLAVDVWEHAYYLKYQNRRAEYLENWWQTVKLI